MGLRVEGSVVRSVLSASEDASRSFETVETCTAGIGD